MKRYLINVLATQDLNEIANYFTTNNIDSSRSHHDRRNLVFYLICGLQRVFS
ncbi:MAG: hypothetical protein LH628_11360 [Microcoleus sp. CAN_BIN18]|nr:hypothetical protein [Microcoleus sp. CAN_BIN18]